jgi:murein tripeptide amidase MpaA
VRRTSAAALLALAATGGLAQEPAPLRANARVAAGHRQLRVTVRTPEELERVLSLSSNVLSCAGAGVGTFDVEATATAATALAAAGIRHEVVHADLGRYFDQVLSDNDRLRARADVGWFEAYRTLDEIEARLAELAAQYPALARLETLGSSLEGRPIRVLRVSGPGATAQRGAFVVNGGQHAREWVTPMTVMYIAERLLLEYGSDARSTALLDKLELYLVPVMNPDGYVYTHGTNAMWRKNRRRGTGTCDGVDLNRNWSHGFGGEGSSPDPCSEIYRGPAAFSEPELLGLKALLDSLAAERRLMLHWDVHSNGASILSPWGYTRTPPRDVDPMNRLGAVIQSGMASVRGRSYPYGTIAVQLYLASGVATDYVYGEHGAMAWGVELSGGSFMPPQTEILPIAQEAFAGLLALSETVPARY